MIYNTIIKENKDYLYSEQLANGDKIKLSNGDIVTIIKINKNIINICNREIFYEIKIPSKLYPDEPGEMITFVNSRFSITNMKYIGFCLQYLTVGLLYGGLPSTVYGFFLGYLNVPAYVYASTGVVITLPWSFKFIFGIMNDFYPIFGYRRKPYMVIGWFICAIFLIILYFKELPEPYYCRNINGKYNKTIEPCNPEAKNMGGEFAIYMMLAAFGYVISDVAADGLMVEYAKKEPINERGRVQTSIYLIRTIGMIISSFLVGFGMNGLEYNGSFQNSLSFNQICGIYFIPVLLMIPISWYGIVELPYENHISIKDYSFKCWNLLKNKSFFFVIIHQFFSPMISGISTPAGGLVKQEWAGVKNLQNQIANIISYFLFAIGLYLIKRYYLNYSWRKMLAGTLIFLNITDMICVYLTIFNVYRNQYFYLGESILDEIPSSFNFIVGTFIVVEMADDGNEGLVYGLLTTISNLGYPFARGIGNQLFSIFNPNVSDDNNYIQDTAKFRNTVAITFLISYLFSFISLFTLIFIPNQKIEAQIRKETWSKDNLYAYTSVIIFILAFTYAVSINIMTILPETFCLKLVGGEGC